MQTKNKILIADDSRFNRILLKEILMPEYDIIEAADGEEALLIMNKEKSNLSLVLLDIMMPKLDGYEVLACMKKTSLLDTIPVVVVTSVANADNEVKTLDLGATDLIFKPYDARVLKQRVKNVILNKESEKVRLENAILKREQQAQIQLQAILDNMIGGVAILELRESIRALYLSKGFYNFKGYMQDSEKGFGHDITEDIIPEDADGFIQSIRIANESNQALSYEFRSINHGGEITWFHIQGVRIPYPDSEYPVFMTIFYDITESKNSEAQLRYRADHDVLTGIYNRSAFNDHTERMLKSSPDIPFILVYWNIDHFKIINDLFGTEVGDRILKTIAFNFNRILRGIGTYARLESDHFVTCIPAGVIDLVELVNRIEQSIRNHNLNYSVVFSLGIYEIEDRTVLVSQMCDWAGLALQTIKGNYLKHTAYYDDALRHSLLQEQEIISQMKHALDSRQFAIFLQPIYSITTEEPISAEALVRWHHPTKGTISPGIFIPLFERTGFIERLDHYVWEEACKYIKHRAENNLSPLPISVNISRVNLYNPDLCDDLISITNRYGVAPSLLKLEITESAYTDNPEQLILTVTTLQEYGFSILMDDFGSGYSSLNMLKDVPVDILKIDMQFLGGFETSNRAGNILTSVVRMAKWLGIPVIAEGVETKIQVDFLRSIGCDRIQGYFFSPPLSITDFEHKTSSIEKRILTPTTLLTKDDDFDSLFNGNQLTSKIFNSVIGGIGIYELTEDKLEVIRVNDTYYDILGYNPQTFYQDASNVFERIYETDRPLLYDACCKAVLNNTVEEIIIRRFHYDNRLLWLKMNIRYLGGSESRPLICITINDVTENYQNKLALLQQQQELKKQYQFLESLYNSLPCAIIQYSFEHPPMVLSCNHTALKTFGYVDEQMFLAEGAHDFFCFISGEDHDYMSNVLERFLMIHSPVDYECRFIRKDNSTVWLRGSLSSTNSSTGMEVIQCTFLDITTQKEAELKIMAQNKELFRYNEFLRILYDNLPCGIIQLATDADFKIVSYNNAIWRLSKYSERTTFHRVLQNDPLSLIHPADRAPLQQILQRQLTADKAALFEMRILCGNGSVCYTRNLIGAVTTPDGRLIMQITITDITEEVSRKETILY